MYLALPASTGGFLQGVFASQYSRIKTNGPLVFAYRAITSFGVSFQKLLLTKGFVTILSTLFVLVRALYKMKNVSTVQPPAPPSPSSAVQ